MSIGVQDLVDTACLLARVEGLKAGVVAELLVPRVITWVSQRAAADPARRSLVTSIFSVALVNGVGAMPPTALVEYMMLAAVSDPADPTMARRMRWIPKWSEFIRPLDLSLGYFTVTDNGNDFVMTRPGAAYAPGAGMTGNIDLVVPARPAVAAGIITCPAEIDQELVNTLVTALKGDWQAMIAAEVLK